MIPEKALTFFGVKGFVHFLKRLFWRPLEFRQLFRKNAKVKFKPSCFVSPTYIPTLYQTNLR
jgi:hypothetical protein